MRPKEKIHERLSTLWWGIKLACKINIATLVMWSLISILIALLPALILIEYHNVLSGLSAFLEGHADYSDVLYKVLILGFVVMISGISAHFNQDYLYTVMYDSFYLGLEEFLIDSFKHINIKELTKKDTVDELYAAHSRCGALTDVISSCCTLLGRFVQITSILLVAYSVSPLLCLIAVLNITTILVINIKNTNNARVVFSEWNSFIRKADYLKQIVYDGDTAKEVRILDNYELIKKEWKEARNCADNMFKRQTKVYAKSNLVCQCSIFLIIGLFTLYSLLLLQHGKMSIDNLLLLFTTGISLSESMSGLSIIIQQLDYGLYGLSLQKDVVKRFCNEKEENRQDEPVLINPSICFKAQHLWFAYPEEVPVIKDVSFEIKNGETVALVGPNGSGKSTLLKLLMGLYDVEPGMLEFYGNDYSNLEKNYLSTKIGAFFQDFFIFHLTLRENVALNNTENINDDSKIRDAADKGGIKELIASWPNGLDQMLKKEIYTDGVGLSGGQSQRIAVARTHMSEKNILIFDEPASMLDPIAELNQFLNIKNKTKNNTAILVSHRVGFARLADRIIVLNHGRIEECGTHNELIKRQGLYAQMFQEQADWYVA